MNGELKRPEVQSYILEHLNDDIHQLILSGSPFESVSAKELAQQIYGRRVMQSKTPDFVIPGMIFPAKINLEQTSSQQTAIEKEKLIQRDCNSFIDITGGFGVDFFYMTKNIDRAVYCEVGKELCELAEYNFSLHKRNMVVNHLDGIEYLQKCDDDAFDCLFVDPSRRPKTNTKVILLESSEPNIIQHWSLLLSKAKRVIVKLSPMIDIQYLKRELSHLLEIRVVAVKQDVKEIVLVAERSFLGDANIIATTIENNHSKDYTGSGASRIDTASIEEYHYLYEPYSALLKAGLQDAYANEFDLKKVDANTHLYFSKNLIDTPLFKSFEILSFPQLKAKYLRKELPSQKLNVVCRNYPLKPEKVLKKLNFQQGGKETLFCFRKGKENKYALTRRVVDER